MTDRLAIVGGAVVTPTEVIRQGTVLCEGGRIVYLGAGGGVAPEPDSLILNAEQMVLMPGFIDTHFHGSGGDDVMANGADGIRRIAKSVLRFGTTGFLATTIAARRDELLSSISETLSASQQPSAGAAILGIHLEGPFINVSFKGAQPEWGIRDPNLEECRELLLAGSGLVKIMTLAPELPGGFELIKLLVESGVEPSLGHSTADYDTALAAIEAGATRATHLFNAMSGLHHRKPGLAAACLCEPGIQAEIICDGVHVDPRMIDLAWRTKGCDGLTLVTDATAAQGHGDGIYTLGDFEIEVRGPLCTLRDQATIAGSVLTMNRAVANAIAFSGMSLVDAASMAASGPARVCGVGDRKGCIAVGMDADFALLNQDFSVASTIIDGRIVYQSN
ncbi:MAG: N-acetylglucosamine-6-phosphate deacetylase [Acidobacteria bacterium]|nr:N-acetylglucosamine-6-phosphate deacetylase [Acidobacteriota bacterium]